MTPSALKILFGVSTNQTATPKPTSGRSAFGDMLSREINGRQNAAPPAPRNPRAEKPQPADRPPQLNSANTPKPAERPTVNAGKNQQIDAPKKPEQPDAPPANDAAQADALDGQTTAKSALADGVDKTAKANKKDKAEKSDKADESANAGTPGDPAAVSAASAELLALVASLMPRTAAAAAVTDPAVAATVTASAIVAGAIDPNAGVAKSTGVSVATDPGAVATEPAAADPAFDALLAQAANSTAARGHAKSEAGAGAGKSNAANDAPPVARTDTDSTQARSNVGAAAATVLAMKTDDIVLAATAVQAGAAKAEPASLAGVAGVTGAMPASLTQAASGAPADTLTPHVGTPAWDHALGQKVVWMAAGAQQSASLMLNPPDLGPIRVVINVTNDQANASFTAAQPEVRQALEAALPRLKEMLGDAGITLGQASVNAGNSSQYGAADQQAGSGPRRANGAAGRDPLDTEPVMRTTTRVVSGGTGLVDTFA